MKRLIAQAARLFGGDVSKGEPIAPDQKRWDEKRKVFEFFFHKLTERVEVSPKQTLLECGVGRWGIGRFYRENFHAVYGVDIEDYSKHHPGVEFAMVDTSVERPHEIRSSWEPFRQWRAR